MQDVEMFKVDDEGFEWMPMVYVGPYRDSRGKDKTIYQTWRAIDAPVEISPSRWTGFIIDREDKLYKELAVNPLPGAVYLVHYNRQTKSARKHARFVGGWDDDEQRSRWKLYTDTFNLNVALEKAKGKDKVDIGNLTLSDVRDQLSRKFGTPRSVFMATILEYITRG